MDNVLDFPAGGPVEFLAGPFQEYRVIIDGREIPKLTGKRYANGRVDLVVDGRFCATFPDDATAYQAAVLAAQAMAIGAGYPHLGAATKDRPFAPQVMRMEPSDVR